MNYINKSINNMNNNLKTNKVIECISNIKKQTNKGLFIKFKDNYITEIDKNGCYYSYNPNIKEIAFVKNKKIVSYYIGNVKELYNDLSKCNNHFGLSMVYNSAKVNSLKEYIGINYLEY